MDKNEHPWKLNCLDFLLDRCQFCLIFSLNLSLILFSKLWNLWQFFIVFSFQLSANILIDYFTKFTLNCRPQLTLDFGPEGFLVVFLTIENFGFLKISQFLARIQMNDIKKICSSKSDLFFGSIYSVRIHSRNWDTFENAKILTLIDSISTWGCFGWLLAVSSLIIAGVNLISLTTSLSASYTGQQILKKILKFLKT